MPDFPRAEKFLTQPWVTQQRLHPLFSNLLPEGAYREYLAQILKVHSDNEFPLFRQLSQDLAGAQGRFTDNRMIRVAIGIRGR